MATDRSCFPAPNRYCRPRLASPLIPKRATRLSEKIALMRKNARHGFIGLRRIMV
jgi:hypothetical protein